MSTQHTPGPFGRQQAIDASGMSMSGWESFTATTRRHGEVESRCELRTPIQSPVDGGTSFIDITITEYTGLSRRAKVCSVRLEEASARKLYEVLHAKFGGAA